jgi:hypothetical protein
MAQKHQQKKRPEVIKINSKQKHMKFKYLRKTLVQRPEKMMTKA